MDLLRAYQRKKMLTLETVGVLHLEIRITMTNAQFALATTTATSNCLICVQCARNGTVTLRTVSAASSSIGAIFK